MRCLFTPVDEIHFMYTRGAQARDHAVWCPEARYSEWWWGCALLNPPGAGDVGPRAPLTVGADLETPPRVRWPSGKVQSSVWYFSGSEFGHVTDLTYHSVALTSVCSILATTGTELCPDFR
jgi:hypothetical protein